MALHKDLTKECQIISATIPRTSRILSEMKTGLMPRAQGQTMCKVMAHNRDRVMVRPKGSNMDLHREGQEWDQARKSFVKCLMMSS